MAVSNRLFYGTLDRKYARCAYFLADVPFLTGAQPLVPIKDFHELSVVLGVCELDLRRAANNADLSYHQFQRRKKSGGVRTITAPNESLKALQRLIADILFATIELSDGCTGYRKGHSIVTNASPHVGKRFVFNTDLKNFFPSICFERVLNVFQGLGHSPSVSARLARICTFRGQLPQGAPSSPPIANLVCATLDKRLLAHCLERMWDYTRYCDDITISGDDRFGMREMRAVDQVIREEGFEVNPHKTRLKRQNSRQMVTGLVVNEKANLPRCQRRELRAAFHQAQFVTDASKQFVDQLAGKLALLKMVDPSAAEIYEYERILELIGTHFD